MVQMGEVKNLKVPLGKKVKLKDYDPGWVPQWVTECEKKEGKKAARERALGIVEANTTKLVSLQELFWASDTYAMLIILQEWTPQGRLA